MFLRISEPNTPPQSGLSDLRLKFDCSETILGIELGVTDNCSFKVPTVALQPAGALFYLIFGRVLQQLCDVDFVLLEPPLHQL